MKVLVVAVSARMLAQLARADGHEVVALDHFGDVDLRAVAATDVAADHAGLTALAEGIDAAAVVYAAGFENRPDLVRRLAAGRELLGTPADLLPAVRDPWAVGAAARAAGACAPETWAVAAAAGARPLGAPPGTPRDDAGWLRKPRHGGGGRGVRAWAGGRLGSREILQRRVSGLSCSATALGDGTRAVVLGLTEQLHRAGGFGWIGNVTPPRLPAAERAELAGRLEAVCAEVVARFGVRGAFGVDAIWDGRGAWVLEVNPRPPASLELFPAGTFDAHVRAVRGQGLPVPSPAPPAIKLVLFADRDLAAPDPAWWPPGLVRDVPTGGEVIRRGAPVCTLLASGVTVPELSERGARLLARLPDAVGVRG